MAKTADSPFAKGLSSPATSALNHAGYTELSQLAGVPRSDLAQLHGMGPKGLRMLQEALEERGLSLS
jgi:hypothetical protein